MPCSLCSLLRLSEQFELPEPTVHSIISKMIIKEELLVSMWREKGEGRGRGSERGGEREGRGGEGEWKGRGERGEVSGRRRGVEGKGEREGRGRGKGGWKKGERGGKDEGNEIEWRRGKMLVVECRRCGTAVCVQHGHCWKPDHSWECRRLWQVT